MKKIHIQLACLRDGLTCISKENYYAEEALKIAKMFLGLKKEAARKICFFKK
ncbi:hypothetical protein [Shewanella chilikensis]|jgi:hypothetical protein|uniref:hypothetical protein n=1 Tax=Shewanella chilikensis TaxID=558541 RepID=UPI001CD71450|nr:hypothetical protein [Shewanella chilikensis]MCA0951683.1 hypothetical protein [Shewanella chilikensis]